MSNIKALKKLFVSNLPYTVGKREFKKYFETFGKVIYADVIFDWKTGFSKGYGFILYKNESSLKSVMSSQPHTLEGGRLVVREAIE